MTPEPTYTLRHEKKNTREQTNTHTHIPLNRRKWKQIHHTHVRTYVAKRLQYAANRRNSIPIEVSIECKAFNVQHSRHLKYLCIHFPFYLSIINTYKWVSDDSVCSFLFRCFSFFIPILITMNKLHNSSSNSDKPVKWSTKCM